MAAVLRFIRIGYGEFFGQEFVTLDLLSGRRNLGFVDSLMRGHLSIYYLLMKPWAHFSGLTSEALLRVPSAMFGLAAWLVFFCYARSYLRGTAFLICILVFALNPILVETSNDASPYSLLALCTVASHLMIVRALDKGGRANWIGYGVATAAGVLTSPLFWFVLPAHWTFAVLRRRKTPEPFRAICTGALALTPVLLGLVIFYAIRNFPKNNVQAPSISDLVRNVVAVVVGNFNRFGATEFVRAMMYLFILACLGLSYVYYRKRTAEAMAMPENVVWIDETQDVVGTWQRLSLRAFLLFQWFTFIIPTLGLILMGAIVPSMRLAPEMFVVALPPLILLLAMGIDAAPKNAIVSLGLMLVLVMANYDVRVLSDRGYGIKQAFHIIRSELNFDPAKDVIIYTSPKQIERAVESYSDDLPKNPIPTADTWDQFHDRQARVAKLVEGKDRAIVIYHDDVREINKTEHSPVREYLKPPKGFGTDRKFGEKDLGAQFEHTEMRIYTRRAPSTTEE
jgi:uncharacterized membrane protein